MGINDEKPKTNADAEGEDGQGAVKQGGRKAKDEGKGGKWTAARNGPKWLGGREIEEGGAQANSPRRRITDAK